MKELGVGVSLLKASDERKYRYPKTTADKGMDNLAMVDCYARIMAKNKGFFRRVAREALSLKPDANQIADIGTGPGFLAIELAKNSGETVKAVDISPNMLIKARELSDAAGVAIETIESGCESLPFESRSLDLVASSNLIHCLIDPQPFFEELKRVLKPGGIALIVGYRRDTWKMIRMIADVHSNVYSKNTPMDGMGAVFDASFTPDELGKIVSQAGFDEFSIKTGIVSLQATLRCH